MAFEHRVEPCAAEMRDLRKIDDQQQGRMIESPLQGGIEMELQVGETRRIDLARRRYHDSSVANVLIHFQ